MKKGQNGNGAVAVVFSLAILILLYLILLPATHREQLLGGSGPGGGPPGEGPSDQSVVLLSQNVGRIQPPGPDTVQHEIPSFTVFTEENAEEIKRRPSLRTQNSVFTTRTATMTFRYTESMDDLKLSFNAKKAGGRLIILLNGDEIFNSEIDNPTPPPIELPEAALAPENNLTFGTSGPGAAFWRVNKHELTNVLVSGQVTDRSGSRATQHFSIPQPEYEAMNGAELSFLPSCEAQQTGRLVVRMNGNEVLNGYADCGVPNTVEIAEEHLKTGDNTLTFRSDEGQYIIDNAKVTTNVDGSSIPVFYFNLPRRVYDRVYVNDAQVHVRLRFPTARAPKSGVLNINGFKNTFQTKGNSYRTQVNPDFLMPGPNSVMIKPQGRPLDLTELRVELR